MGLKLKTIIGPSPVGYLSKKLINRVRGGSSQAWQPLAEIDSYAFEFDEIPQVTTKKKRPKKPKSATVIDKRTGRSKSIMIDEKTDKSTNHIVIAEVH